MQYWQELLAGILGILLLAVLLHRSLGRRKRREEQDFTRNLETLLQPKETVKVICPQKGGRCILTNKRIIVEKKGKFTAFSLHSVQKIQGVNAAGNRTSVPANMSKLIIKADVQWVVHNMSVEFCELAKQLGERVKKNKEKTKDRKAAK